MNEMQKRVMEETRRRVPVGAWVIDRENQNIYRDDNGHVQCMGVDCTKLAEIGGATEIEMINDIVYYVTMSLVKDAGLGPITSNTGGE